MLIRLALALTLAVTGAGVTSAGITSAVTTLPGFPRPSQVDAGPAGVAVAATPESSGETTVTELDLVLPAVEPTGEVVESPAIRAAQADAAVIVADQVVDPMRVESEVVETGEFQTLGVTWPLDAQVGELGAQVRTRADGQWSDWVPLEAADDAPDPGTADALNAARGGTDSLWVGDADGVQLSFAATPAGGPEGLSLALVHVPEVTAPAGAAGAAAVSGRQIVTADYVTGVVPTAVPTAASPRIISRGEWGARPQVCTPDVASKLVGAVVHHTAGRNTYANVEEAKRQIRGDQAYHIDGRQWCDIGYNFIVDKWGNLYEGRAGSLDAAVIGVHAGGFNTGTVAISMLGTYDAVPSAAVQQTVGQIIGLRLSAYNVDPQGSMTYYTTTGQNSKYQNQNVALPRVFGHREVAFTACPGPGGFAALPNIRAIAHTYYDAKLFGESRSVVRALYQDLLGRGPDPTGLAGWTAALMQGTSQAELVDSLTRSDEYIWSRVTKAYREVLGREAEQVGATSWLNAIKGRQATVDDVQRRFYDSAEYFAASGGTPEGYVGRLFTTMLHRSAAPAEVSSWVSLYHQRGRAWVVDSIWFSGEAAAVRAGAYYQTFLGRGPDPSGQAAWAQVLLAHGEGAVRIGIAGSLEYRGRAISRYP